MSGKTKTVFHPVLAGVKFEVPEGNASGWKDAGWRFTDPKIVPASTSDPVEPAVVADVSS